MEKLNYTPMPPYFIIKIGKEAQRKNKEYLTAHILSNPSTVSMRRELQFGEIVSIGESAKEWMPIAEPGDYLLCHHFISGKKNDRGYNFYLVDEDDDFNYYAVNGFEVPGERAMAYAVARGEEIIPTPDYIFLEVPKEDSTEMFCDKEISGNGLVVPKEKKKTREEWTAIMKANMARIQQLARNIPHGPMEEIMNLRDPQRRERSEYAVAEIKKLEAINTRISKDINKKKYEPFVVAAVNPDWNKYIESIYGEKIHPGQIVHFLNLASHYRINFGTTEFIVAEVKYFGCQDTYIRNAINNFNGIKRHNPSSKKRADKVRG